MGHNWRFLLLSTKSETFFAPINVSDLCVTHAPDVQTSMEVSRYLFSVIIVQF
jgi:hypothetical protein